MLDSDSREKLTKRLADRARETARSQLGISTRKRVAVPGGIRVDPWMGFPDAGSADSASDGWAQFPDIN